jgi:hypothetical protein
MGSKVDFREAQAVGSIVLLVAITLASILVDAWPSIWSGFLSCIKAFGG